MDTENNATPAEHLQELTLPAEPRSVGKARRHVLGLLRDWASPVNRDTVVLLLSEVLTNAIKHGAGPEPAACAEVRVVVRQSPEGLYVEVHDHVDGTPTPVHNSEDWAAESGRGLVLLEELADGWGTQRKEHGKYVYFFLAPETTELRSDFAEPAARQQDPRRLQPPTSITPPVHVCSTAAACRSAVGSRRRSPCGNVPRTRAPRPVRSRGASARQRSWGCST